jgi:hypothetical protein
MANKFTGINAAKRLEKAESEPTIEKATETPAKAAETAKKVGRPTGKKSNSDFRQITAYVRKDTVRNIKKLLLERDELKYTKMDFSDVIEEGLIRWIENEKRHRL